MSAESYLPAAKGLTALRAAAGPFRGCDLYQAATQTVFGEGRARARAVMMGEQPGDKEDEAGRPFVGPAGRIPDRALHEVGIGLCHQRGQALQIRPAGAG